MNFAMVKGYFLTATLFAIKKLNLLHYANFQNLSKNISSLLSTLLFSNEGYQVLFP